MAAGLIICYEILKEDLFKYITSVIAKFDPCQVLVFIPFLVGIWFCSLRMRFVVLIGLLIVIKKVKSTTKGVLYGLQV